MTSGTVLLSCRVRLVNLFVTSDVVVFDPQDGFLGAFWDLPVAPERRNYVYFVWFYCTLLVFVISAA